jgi:hypothetical protein
MLPIAGCCKWQSKCPVSQNNTERRSTEDEGQPPSRCFLAMAYELIDFMKDTTLEIMYWSTRSNAHCLAKTDAKKLNKKGC